MSATKRKRASAFDDFPEQAGETQRNGAIILPVSQTTVEAPPMERIERLKPSQMMPDRFQPRRLLPATLRRPFFDHEIDCYQAASQWLDMASQDLAHKEVIDRLLAMGSSFDEHGQIKPITGSWQLQPDGRYMFIIETGERRFWAACLVVARDHLPTEPLLRVEAVETPTRQRQVLENRHSDPPSAVSQACEVASLILADLGQAPDPETEDEFEYFRKAREQRMPAGLWERITPIMQLTRPRMVQLLNILQLPASLLELADRHRLPERVLREVLAMPPEQWEQVMNLSIQNKLTSEDVAVMAKPSAPKPTERKASSTFLPPDRVALGGLRRFANALNDLDEFSQAHALEEVANTLVVTGEADGMMLFLGDLASRIDARRSRR
ncbi:MAG: hypothetical protein HPY76_10200 [Anaerolineae bacterium]|nr:hypothetical protein [Anaerolineae bacterium]